jgi:hypothetical protein
MNPEMYLEFDMTTVDAGNSYDSWLVLAYTTDCDADITDAETWSGTIIQNWVAENHTCEHIVVDLSFLCGPEGAGVFRLNFWDESGYSGPDMLDNIVVYQPSGGTPTPTPTVVPPTATPTMGAPYPVWTPTYPPEPTPACDELGCTIEMPSDMYHPGDLFYTNVGVCNPDAVGYGEHPLFVVLDVYGMYYFAPSFTSFDYYEVDVDPGLQTITVVPEFTWPSGSGDAQGIFWYAAMTDPEMTELFGAMDAFEFGWTE